MINKAQAPYKSLRDSTGQATLEFTLIFVIMVALLFGLLGLWKWSSDSIIQRQLKYNTSRLEAGSTTPGKPSAGDMYQASQLTDNQTYLFKK